ncbi:hypothetical protein Tco_0399718 [Tanacetum coccineum]
MRTRNSNFPNKSNVTIPRRRNRGRAPNVVEPEPHTIVEVAPMAERTMEELLRAPTEGYGEAIVLPEINVDHFEIKTNLLQLVQANPFHGLENKNPHANINSFKRITLTLRFRDVPNDVIKLMMFPYSLEGNARLCEAWERFKEMLRACPHHGFTELTQVDTFYNGLNDNDQDSLNAAAGGNLLSKTTREALNIIENKSKVRYSRNKPNASRINTTSRESDSKTDERIDKLADQLSTLVEIVSKKVVTPAPVKAVEETCVTCGGAHSWYNCPTTDNNQASVCATTGTYNQVNPPNRVSNQMAPPGFAPVQNNGQNRFNQNQVQGNNFNRGNNFHGNQGSTAQIPPPVTPIPILEPDVPKTLPKTTSILESDVLKNLPKQHIPYPSRLNQEKSRDKASNQKEKIFQMFQDLRFDISFADALLLMPRFAPTIKSLLMNKEKLLELAKILLNENCSAMLLKKLPEKLGDPCKFLIPCNFTGMDDNFKKFTDEPALVRLPPSKDDNDEKEKQEVKNLAEPTAKTPTSYHTLVSSYGVEHLSTFSAEEIVPIPRESEDTSRSDSKNVLPSCDDFSSINVPRDDSVTFSNPLFEFDVNFNSIDFPSHTSFWDECLAPGDDIEILLHHDPSTPMKSVASILEGFIDDPPFEENDDLFDLECKMNDWKRILYDAPIDKAECFDPGGDNDEIDAFLAIEVPMYIEEGYYDSEGDVIYLESLLSDDTTHNLSPQRIIREHEDYINRISLLCGNSSSRSPENSHTIIESLPTSTTLIEDSDSNREEIDIISD